MTATALEEINKIRRSCGLPPKAASSRAPITSRQDRDPLVEAFLLSCSQRNLAKATLIAYSGDLYYYIARAGQGLPDAQKILSYKAILFEEPLAPATRLRRMITLAAWCGWLVEEGHMEASPVRRRDLQIKLPRVLPRHLHAEAVRGIFDKLYAQRGENALRDQALFEVLACTGIRIGELVALDCDHFDAHRGVLRVTGKGSRERIVPVIDAAALVVVRKHHARVASGPLFVSSRTGKRLSAQSVRTLLTKLAPGVTPHQFRHTFATTLLRDGVDTRFIQRLLGHSSILTTQRYTGVDDASLVDVLTSHNPRKLLRRNAR